VKVGRKRVAPVVVLASALLVLVCIGALFLLLSGRGPTGLVLAALKSPSVSNDGDFTNVIFLHHSTGRNLIEQGAVRERFAESGYDFWDHGYNGSGVTRPDGSAAGFHYYVPDNNTDPDGLARIFAQPVYGLPLNTFSGLLQHEVIAFKSCFTASDIESDEQLEMYKTHYLGIRDVMDHHPDRVFIVLTPPPLNPAETDAETAARVRAFADWLASDEYRQGHPNVFTFDFFDLLAEGDRMAPDHNMLKQDYRDGADSHPNAAANETIGPVFVDFVIDVAWAYRAVY
jgi:hypothetical protein